MVPNLNLMISEEGEIGERVLATVFIYIDIPVEV